MQKKINEVFSSNPSDTVQLVDGSYNISKVDDPIELKRLNNYIASVFTSAIPFHSKKDTLNQLRTKLNLLGFDIDLPKALRETGETNLTLPLKRFGGITGVDDKGQKLNNPYGPGPKMDIKITGTEDFLNASIVPAAALPSNQETSIPSEPAKVVTPEPTKDPVKESFSFSEVSKYIRRK